jgi:hypothetical protein
MSDTQEVRGVGARAYVCGGIAAGAVAAGGGPLATPQPHTCALPGAKPRSRARFQTRVRQLLCSMRAH